MSSQRHSWNRRRAALEFMKEQLPSGVLSAQHFRKIVALLENSDSKVKIWTLDLLQGRMPNRLLAVLLAEHWEKIWPLSEQTHRCRLQLRDSFCQKQKAAVFRRKWSPSTPRSLPGFFTRGVT